jgi:hypothetical protein
MSTISKVTGIDIANVSKFVGLARANTTSKLGLTIPSAGGGTPWASTLFQFDDQATQESYISDWSPSATHASWVNGTSAVNGTYWGLTSNKVVKGWNLGQDTTPSSTTGPGGGVVIPGGATSTSTGADQYLYVETSAGRSNYCQVVRSPAFNFSTLMDNQSGNLDLKFWVHAYGSQIGDLYVYIDTAASSTDSGATLLASYTSFSGFTTYTSAYQEKTVSLNSYRAINSDHYIYFISQNATGYWGDLAIDGVQAIES